jgi:subtilisin family serine protease
MAAPHVSGLAVLLISAHPELGGEVDMLEQIMRLSSVPLTTSESCGGLSGDIRPNNTFGWGRIDAWRAVNLKLLYLPMVMGK